MFAEPCTKRNPVWIGEISMHQSAVNQTCTPGSSGILSYSDSARSTKGVRFGQVSPREHENQSVQLGWVAGTAEFRDYIILVM